MEGKRSTPAMLTIVDRKSRFTLIKKLNSKKSDEVNSATLKLMKKYLCKSMTNDNGVEFGKFWKLETKLKSKVYYCRPMSPWERGTVENTIGLMRQVFKKGEDYSSIKNKEIKLIQDLLNHRPRKILNYKTPYEVMYSKKTNLIFKKELPIRPVEDYEEFY